MEIKKIIIADDQHLFANGIKELLEQEEDIEVIAIIKKGDNVLQAITNLQPDALLLDLNMPNKNGFEILEEIRNLHSALPIGILSTYDSNSFIEKAKTLNADAYFSKDASIDELRQFIFQDYISDFLLSDRIKKRTKNTKVIFDNFAQAMQLTKRELQIIKLIANGFSTKEIAEKLFITDFTVKTHRKNIFKKLKIKSISELIKIAYENKII